MNKELQTLVEKLCEDLTKAMHTRWKHSRGVTTHNYSVGQKYIRIFSEENGQARSAWGFINKKEFQHGLGKGNYGVNFTYTNNKYELNIPNLWHVVSSPPSLPPLPCPHFLAPKHFLLVYNIIKIIFILI